MYSTCCSVSPLGYCDLSFLWECALGLVCDGSSEECGEALLDGVFVLGAAELELDKFEGCCASGCVSSGGGDI